MNIKEINSVYFIGIGGIGMSAIARYFNDHGVIVSGYDKTQTPLTIQLAKEGISIFYSEDIHRIPKDVDLVVYTPAIPSTHTELAYYLASDIPTLKRAVVLGQIVNQGVCFAVAGSHGKSTTSAMLTHILKTGGIDVTAFLGAIASNYDSNYVIGLPDQFVVEADEFDRSFHQIFSSHAIITSVDSDHLDIYGSMDGIIEGFTIFSKQLRDHGMVYLPETEPFQHKLNQPYTTYGFSEQSDVQAYNIVQVDGGYRFDVKWKAQTIKGISLSMGGMYNILNALAVIALAKDQGVINENIITAFNSFKGLKRRFELIAKSEEQVMIDDYAHHPHEIRSFIEGIRSLYPSKKIGAIFQPHLYSRTQDYAAHFAESLELIDEVLVMEIYPAREEPIPGVSSELITSYIKNTPHKVVTHETVIEQAMNMNVDVLATIGAGDISKIVEPLKKVWIRDGIS